MRAAIYCRVSTREQAESGYSIPDQLRSCHEKAKELRATVVEEFIDNESGAFLERAGLDLLRQKLRQKYFNFIITKSPDRLSRNITHQLILRDEIIKSGAQLVFLSFEWQNTPDGRLLMNVQGVISDYEREVIRERTMMGRRSKVLAGKIPLNSHVYGYFYDKKQSAYFINEEEAEVVRNIFNWLIYGDASNVPMGGIAIAKKLADSRIKPPRRTGESWAKATVYKILKNNIYTGTAYFYRQKKRKIGPHIIEVTKRPESDWLPVTVPSIISMDIFETAQRKLRENSINSTRNTKHRYLLQGLVYCDICGRRMAINPERQRQNKTMPAYYACPTGRPDERRFYVHTQEMTAKCTARTTPVAIVEAKVWSYIGNLYNSDEDLIRQEVLNLYKNIEANYINIETIINELHKKEDNLLNRRKKIAKWFRDELLSELEAEKELKQIKNQLLDIEEQKRNLQSYADKSKNEDNVNSIVQQIKSISNPDVMPFEEKRAFLTKILNGIYIKRTDSAWGYGTAKRIALDIRLDFNLSAAQPRF